MERGGEEKEKERRGKQEKGVDRKGKKSVERTGK